MARAQVSYERYQSGDFPPVSVISGEPSDQLLILRTPVDDPRDAWINPPRWVKGLDQLVTRIDVRRSRDILLGRLPVARVEIERLDRARKLWTYAQLAALIVFVWSAAAGVALSPWLVAGSVVAIVWTARRRRMTRETLPHPTLIHGGTTVLIDNVHPSFADMVDG